MTWNMARILIEAAAGALAVAGAFGLAVGAPVLGLILLGSAVLVTAGLVGWSLRADPSLNPLGSAAATRALITAGVTFAVGRIELPGQVSGTVLSAAVLVGVLATEGLLRRVGRYTVPVVAHLSGLTRPRPAPNLARHVVLAGLAANACGLVVAAAGGSAWWWLLAAVLAALPAALVMWFGRRARSQAAQLSDRLSAAVARYGPKFLVYTSRPDDASYQVTMWLPYLKRTGLPFVIVTRAGEPAEALARLTDVPVVEARSLRALESIVVPSLRAVFYVNASSGNGALVRIPSSRTSISVTATRTSLPRTTRPMPCTTRSSPPDPPRSGATPSTAYDPRGEVLHRRTTPSRGGPARYRTDHEVEHPTVLYAPTWRGHVEETMLYSLPRGRRSSGPCWPAVPT